MVLKCDTSACHGLAILLYKGLLLRKRHYVVTTFELILPVIIASIPVIFLSETELYRDSPTTEWTNDTVYPAFDPFLKRSHIESDAFFAYAPSNNNTDILMEDALKLFKDKHSDYNVESKGLEDGNDLENYCMAMQRNNSRLAIVGTMFNNIHSEGERLPPNLDYTIRCADSSFETNMKYRYDSKPQIYSSSFFLSWQAAVEKTFIQKKMLEGNEVFDYELWMQEFPYPRHREMKSHVDLALLFPIVMVYGFLLFVLNLVNRVIEEKSTGSRELLKMMGMTNFAYWFSTFLNYFLIGALVILIITIIYKSPLKNSSVFFPNSNFLLLFILLLLFTASLILFSFALTTFFNKAIFGIVVMLIIYNVSYLLLANFVFQFVSSDKSYFLLSFIAKFCICLLPTGALLTISEMISAYEKNGEGLWWTNLYNSDIVLDFNISWLMIAMLLSCFLYVVIIWYVDAVWPWQYGAPKPVYFPFTKSYWCGYKETKVEEIMLGAEDETKSTDFFEDDPTGMTPGVIIKNLSKVFRTGIETKVAVNNVSLNIYKGQITALLGHNGAGKTTTINILTGLYSPSAGTASINGWDIFSQTTKARQSLGVCPQHNLLYDTLTVEEHLKIYAALKGVSWRQLDKEAANVLSLLNLVDKKTELAKNLSGGMKRKLNLGIALVGGSKVLFLDEPTSGMDVEARRNVWDTLLDIRHDHTIVLTTHYMEEADILGDRIAIMADGEIQCCGSPLFLKKKFGTGYHLHLVKEKDFDMNAVSDILEKYVPSATLENDYEREVTFNLMSNVQSKFGTLFEEIELKKDALGVSSCGVTVTTIEDVFLNVAHISDLKLKKHDFSLENVAETELKDIYIELNEFGRSQKWGKQFWGLLLKRFHYAKRYWHVIIPQLILPFILLCLCLFSINIASPNKYSEEPSLKLDIDEIYGETDGFYHSDSDPSSEPIALEIKKVLEENNVNAKSVEDPEEFVLNYGSKSMSDYYKHLLVGGNAEMSNGKLNVTAWFNGFPYHAVPISLLLMNTAILRRVTNSGYIALTNDPLPIRTFFNEDPDHTKERDIAEVFVPLALSILAASFVLVPIHERTSKAKLLQLMTGINSATYWLSMFVWDFIIVNTIVTLLLIIPFAIFSHYAFFSPHSEAIGTVIIIMILFGWSSIPFSYLFSLIFKKPNTGFAVIIITNIIFGIVAYSIIAMITDIPEVCKKTMKTLSWVFKLFPSFALSSGISRLFVITYANSFCESISQEDLNYSCQLRPDLNPILKCCKDICGSSCLNKTYPLTMDEKACGRDILFLFLDGILYFLLLLLLESTFIKMLFHKSCQRLRKCCKVSDDNGTFSEDSDVLQEEERVRSNYEQVSHNDALVVVNLTKRFKNLTAVNRLAFGIHKKECFGLLGVNGAGKTTTFRMLVGDCYPTEGNAFIGKYSVINDLKKFQSHIGYCPQFDALIDRLSAREMITLFARLRGLKGLSMTKYVNALIKMTDLTQYADKPTRVYSGGNKRKLSIALALIGAPPLLLLDEPTSGVDPVSRRKIWKILSLARIHSGAAVILTTHSMEESEALCSRLAIMVNGRFRCLGSIQQLKTKFGQGYTLIIKMKKEEQSIPQSMNAVKAFIDTNLPGANLKDDHQGMLQYHVVNPSVTLSHLFQFMDNMKNTFNLEDYVVSDTSLEQIFLSFAKTQR